MTAGLILLIITAILLIVIIIQLSTESPLYYKEYRDRTTYFLWAARPGHDENCIGIILINNDLELQKIIYHYSRLHNLPFINASTIEYK